MIIHNIHIEKVIATGANSKIYLGRNLDTLESVAIKKVKLENNGSILYENEINILTTLSPHKNFPKIHGYSIKRSKGYIVMEYLPFPTLKTFLKNKGALLEEQALIILKQILNAVMYMIKHGVAHRDFKSENIIINPDNLAIKIIDFGLGKVDLNSLNNTDNVSIGTPIYMAPKVLVCDEKSQYKIVASDMWSVGIIYWECIIGYHPYINIGTKKELIKIQLEDKKFAHYSPTTQYLLESLLDINEDKRMTASEAIEFIKHMGKWKSSSVDNIIPLEKHDKSRFISYLFTNRHSSDDVILIKNQQHNIFLNKKRK